MRGKVIVLLIAMTVLMTTAATWASQIDNEYVYSISKALFENYTFAELDNFHEQDVIHAARELGFQRELTEAEVIKLRCIIGAIEMPYVSPLWHEGYTPTPTGKPARPEITLGKVDGSNAFDLVWQNDGVADSAKYAISDIATTGPDNDLDNDGKPEIVVTCKNQSDNSMASVVVFEQTDDDSYAQVWYHNFAAEYAKADTAHTRSTRVELGDLDGDGDLDIICGVRCLVTAKTDFGCVRVFAWDGVNGSDNYGTDPASTYDLNLAGSQWATAMATGNIDEDPALELIVAENVTNYAYVLDVTGTFGGAVTWNQEYCDSVGAGSPYAAAVGDCDGDGNMEFYITRWWNLRLHTYEWDGASTYNHYGYVQLESVDDYSWEGTKVSNFDGDSYSEVYVPGTAGNLWVFTNTGDVSAASYTKLDATGISMFGAAVGDQDHGPGSDGGDLYVCAAGGDLWDYEFTGTDVTNISDYTKYTIFSDPNDISGLMCAVGDSLDLDGEHEVVVGNAEAIKNPSVFVLEHGEFRAHDVGVDAIAPEFTFDGQGGISATIRNFGANNETGIGVYWSTSTGDNGSEGPVDILSQETENVNLGWTADTTGLVTMTVWTVLAGDENAANDTLSTSIYVYPPETSSYTYQYYTESPNRTRGVGVFGNDDYCVGVKNSPYSIEFYHNAPDSVDVVQTYWENPGDPGDHIDLIWNWGIGVDNDLNAYLANQDANQSILVYDYDGNSTAHRLEVGTDSGVEYITACDIDDAGYVYVAFYINGPGVTDQIKVYDKLANWNDATHTATLMTSFEPAAYVCEGLCVSDDGSTIWLTNRSAPGSLGDVTRWTGSPSTGYVQDSTFAGDGTMDVPGYVRGIALAPDGDVYVLSDVDVQFDGDKLFIGDGTTGELKYTIDIDDPGTYHKSPYDIDFSLVGDLDLVAEKAGGDDINLSWNLPTATAFYVTHMYGWYVDKWEGPGFKGATSYAVYRDTVPDFPTDATTLLDTTSNAFYLDDGAAGDTGTQYYYIVRATGTPGYTSKSTTIGEYDKGMQNVK
jgi:hypothetical protein